jgi:hypothetical protein
MKRFLVLTCITSALFSTSLATTALAQHSLGIGVHYLRSLGDFDEANDLGAEIEENNFGILGSYQFDAGLLKLEANGEYVFDYLGQEGLFEPSAYALIGDFIYGGAGIGIGHFNDRWFDDPFYALRAGVNLPLGSLGLDIYGTYRFQSDDELEDLTGDDLDSVTLAVVLRKSLGGGGGSSE